MATQPRDPTGPGGAVSGGSGPGPGKTGPRDPTGPGGAISGGSGSGPGSVTPSGPNPSMWDRLFSPPPVFKQPVVDAIFSAMMPTPITLGLMMTHMIQAITGDMGGPGGPENMKDVQGNDSTTGGAGGDNNNAARRSAAQTLFGPGDGSAASQAAKNQGAQLAPAPAQAATPADNSAKELANILSETQKLAARRNTVLTSQQGLSSTPTTAKKPTLLA